MYKKIVVLLALVALGVCEEVAKDVKDCAKNADCVEKTVVKMIDEMDNQEKVEVLGDFLTVTKTGESAVARKDEGAFDRFLRFVSNHNMKIKFPTSEAGVQKLLNGNNQLNLNNVSSRCWCGMKVEIMWMDTR